MNKKELILLASLFAVLCTSAQLKTPNYDFDVIRVKLDESKELAPGFGKDSSWYEGFDISQKAWTLIFLSVRSLDLDPVLSIRSKHGSWDTLIRLKRNANPILFPRLMRVDDSIQVFVFAEGHKKKGKIEVGVFSENIPSPLQQVQPATKDGLDMLFAGSHFLYHPLFRFKEDTSSTVLKIYTSGYRLFGKTIERATLKEGPPLPILFTILENELTEQQAANKLKQHMNEVQQWSKGRPEIKVEWAVQSVGEKLPVLLIRRTNELANSDTYITFAKLAIRAGNGYYFISLESDMMFY